MLMLSNADNAGMCYDDIDDKFWEGRRRRRRRRPKAVPRAAVGFARQLKNIFAPFHKTEKKSKKSSDENGEIGASLVVITEGSEKPKKKKKKKKDTD